MHTRASSRSLGAVAPAAETSIAGALPSRCAVQSRTSTPDGSGGRTIAYSTAAEDVRCRIKDVTRAEKRMAGGKVVYTVRAVGEFDLAAPITRTSRIVVGDDVWDVLGIDEGVTSELVITCQLVLR